MILEAYPVIKRSDLPSKAYMGASKPVGKAATTPTFLFLQDLHAINLALRFPIIRPYGP